MQHHRISLLQISRLSGYAYSSLKRWRSRMRRGYPVIEVPGPKKTGSVDMAELSLEIDSLQHRKKRSLGSGALHRRHGAKLSRRNLNALIGNARRERLHRQQAHSHRICWSCANLAWAIDDTKLSSARGWIHTIRDLASRFTLAPITGPLAHGEQIAGHLEDLFRVHGAPLVLKRDNGSNLNHDAINQLLGDWLVIPLNSPAAYPQYNGAIENAQRDWDRQLPDKADYMDLRCSLAAHDVNHRPRRILNGRTPCAVFNGRDKLKLNRRQRKEAIEEIKELTLELIDRFGHNSARAWRTAVQSWLHMNHLITIRKPKNCYPVF